MDIYRPGHLVFSLAVSMHPEFRVSRIPDAHNNGLPARILGFVSVERWIGGFYDQSRLGILESLW